MSSSIFHYLSFHRGFIFIYHLGYKQKVSWWPQLRDTVLPHQHEHVTFLGPKYSPQHGSFKQPLRSSSAVMYYKYYINKEETTKSVSGVTTCVIILNQNANFVKLMRSLSCMHKINCDVFHLLNASTAITD
jgi:hypothetical protein